MLFKKKPPEILNVAVPVADIRDKPGGARLRQLLFGETVKILRNKGDHLAIEAVRDGYKGMMARADLGDPKPLSHRVSALATHVYSEPDIKSPELMTLSFGARLSAESAKPGPFLPLLTGGYVPSVHCRLANRRFSDPVAVAEMFIGTPYLWGGNSRLGIDCSGLVQVSALACGLQCPGDSGEQRDALGDELDAAAELRRGDLLFWKGHVAWVSGPDRMIHANAHHMAVAIENLGAGIKRIKDQGGGDVIGRRRINLFKAS
ncbi:NlpC/P60 family protein [Mangrovicoccus sp. HB161399]|uniref:C40 family peptidase n=1 Tax=Mangrovicoccus sp. HB161399 TaxID=2720392 RepID=UPI001554B555|nr:NlpC/P60 family protein [Mangrovicoccus sp. HB161399]